MMTDRMEFEQKAEEKKMSMSKNIARLAVTAGLTAALSFGGVMAPVTMAFAEGAATGCALKTQTAINYFIPFFSLFTIACTLVGRP